jgi:hypothetical protein
MLQVSSHLTPAQRPRSLQILLSQISHTVKSHLST